MSLQRRLTRLEESLRQWAEQPSGNTESLSDRLDRTGREFDAFLNGAPRPDWLAPDDWQRRVETLTRLNEMYDRYVAAATCAGVATP